MIEKHDIDTAAHHQSGRRGRRAVFLGAGVAAVTVVLVAIASAPGGDRGNELATENRPSDDEVLCDPLADDHPTCVREPSPMSTTIDANDVDVTTLSTISPTTTMPATPLHLEGSDSTLRVTADLETPLVLAGRPVRLNVHISEADGYAASMGVNFGDGHSAGSPSHSITCRADRTTTTAPAGTREETQFAPYSYRLPGTYTIVVSVASKSCDRPDHFVTLLGDVLVGPGANVTNGPFRPTVVGAGQVPTSGSPHTVKLNVHVRDVDGYITSVTVKWGDGAQETKEYPMSYCIDPKTYFRPSSDAYTLEHSYGAGGAYDVEVVVSSSGCSGGDPQTNSKVFTVNVS